MLRPLTELQLTWARGLCRGPVNGSGVIETELIVRADLGSAKSFSALGVVGLNNAVAGGGLSFSNTAFGNTDQGTGTMANDGLNGATHGNSLWYVPTAAKSCRYIELRIGAYLPDGFRHIDARRLLIMHEDGTASTTARLSDGVDFNWSLTHVDLSSAQVTPRGGVFVDPQGTYRELRFSVTGMTATEASDLRTWLAAARRATECVVSLRTENTDVLQSNRTIYGRLVEWAPIVHTGGDTYACENITVNETPYPALS